MKNQISAVFLLGLLVSLCGCSAPTPGERVKQLGGIVTEKGDGVVDLDLSGSRVRDDDMAYICGFLGNDSSKKAIHTLDLSDTRITDKSLEYLGGPNGYKSPEELQVLVIKNTKVTDVGVKKFQSNSPNCEVVR